eukprot:3912252-Rhodomonas_salina.1
MAARLTFARADADECGAKRWRLKGHTLTYAGRIGLAAELHLRPPLAAPPSHCAGTTLPSSQPTLAAFCLNPRRAGTRCQVVARREPQLPTRATDLRPDGSDEGRGRYKPRLAATTTCYDCLLRLSATNVSADYLLRLSVCYRCTLRASTTAICYEYLLRFSATTVCWILRTPFGTPRYHLYTNHPIAAYPLSSTDTAY